MKLCVSIIRFSMCIPDGFLIGVRFFFRLPEAFCVLVVDGVLVFYGLFFALA